MYTDTNNRSIFSCLLLLLEGTNFVKYATIEINRI